MSIVEHPSELELEALFQEASNASTAIGNFFRHAGQ